MQLLFSSFCFPYMMRCQSKLQQLTTSLHTEPREILSYHMSCMLHALPCYLSPSKCTQNSHHGHQDPANLHGLPSCSIYLRMLGRPGFPEKNNKHLIPTDDYFDCVAEIGHMLLKLWNKKPPLVLDSFSWNFFFQDGGCRQNIGKNAHQK